MKNKSFTLIELLVVIVIIGILAGVIIVSVSSSINMANFAKAQAFSSNTHNKLWKDLVSEWTFDLPAVSGITEDTGGNNDGTVSGATYIPRSSGGCVYGGCYEFDGTDNYINLGNSFSNNLVTLFAWANISSDVIGDSSEREVLCSYEGGGYGLMYSGNKYVFQIYADGVGYTRVTANNPSTAGWNHVVGTYDGISLKLYIDGVLQNDINYGVYTIKHAINMWIGANPPVSTSNNWKGLIDEVRIYNAALSSSQIKQEYVAGLDSLLSKSLISKEEYSERLNNLALGGS